MSLLQHEADLVRERVHGLLVTDALLHQHALAALFSEEAGAAFKALVERLTDGD